jgi:hypothetical protein
MGSSVPRPNANGKIRDSFNYHNMFLISADHRDNRLVWRATSASAATQSETEASSSGSESLPISSREID